VARELFKLLSCWHCKNLIAGLAYLNFGNR
jgi:hypothetical protein